MSEFVKHPVGSSTYIMISPRVISLKKSPMPVALTGTTIRSHHKRTQLPLLELYITISQSTCSTVSR